MRTKFIGIVLATLVLIAPAYADAVFTTANVTSVVPEPFTLLLVGSSLLGLAWVVRRKMS